MSTTLDYHDGDERAPGMFFLREALSCAHLGVTDVDPGWTGMDHDHEEVCVPVAGAP